MGKRAEFCATANKNVDSPFQRVRIVRRLADLLDVLKKLPQTVRAIIKGDHAIAGISARAPQKVGLMTTQGRRQAVATSEKINVAGLAVTWAKVAQSGRSAGAS